MAHKPTKGAASRGHVPQLEEELDRQATRAPVEEERDRKIRFEAEASTGRVPRVQLLVLPMISTHADVLALIKQEGGGTKTDPCHNCGITGH